jgi:hypothetical protein
MAHQQAQLWLQAGQGTAAGKARRRAGAIKCLMLPLLNRKQNPPNWELCIRILKGYEADKV